MVHFSVEISSKCWTVQIQLLPILQMNSCGVHYDETFPLLFLTEINCPTVKDNCVKAFSGMAFCTKMNDYQLWEL